MSLFNTSDLTLDREDIKSLSEAILTAFFQKPAVTEFHTLIPGIVHDKQIAILGIFEGLVGKAKADCGGDPNPGSVRSVDKTWTPKYIGDRFEQCFAPLLDTFFKWGLKNGYDKADLTSTEFAVFIEGVITDAIVESVYRHAWFGDTDAANTNASPAGIISPGVDLGYFNVIDGLWKQIYAISTATPTQLSTGLSSRNGQANHAAQKFTTALTGSDVANQVVTQTLLDMVDNADERLVSGTETPIFIVTKSVADQYKRERKAFANIELSYTRIEDGILVLKCDGFDMYVFSFWDRMIKAYEDNGTKYHLPHRAILTTKSNLQIGTEEESNLSDFNAFFAPYEEKYVLKFAYNLDAKFVEDYKGQFAY